MSARWSDKQERRRQGHGIKGRAAENGTLHCQSWGVHLQGVLLQAAFLHVREWFYFKPMIGTRVSEMKEINSEMPTVSFRSAFLSFPF